MTRQGRTLVLIAVVSLAGVTALAALARHYARLTGGAPAPVAASTGSASPQPAGTAPVEGATGAQAQVGGPETAVAQDPAARLVDGFIEVRRVVKAVMDEHPHAFRSFHGELRGTHQGKVKSYNDVLFALRSGKEKAFVSAGITKQEYARVRQAWRARSSASEPADPELARALDAREADLAAVSLGDYEELDFDF